MPNQPDANKKQADAETGKRNSDPQSAVLKVENDAKVTSKDGNHTQDTDANIEIAHPPTPGRFRRTWVWLKTKSSEASIADWAMVFFTLVIAVSTVIFTVYAGRQWREMRDGGVDTHKLAEATLATSRAWVVVRTTKFGYLKDESHVDRVSSNVELTNTGPSPAFNVRGWRCAQVLAQEPSITETEPTQYPKDCITDDLGMIGKDIPVTLHVNDLTQKIAPNSLSKDMRASREHFYAWGYYTYDVTPPDRRHFMSFCLVNSGGGLGACRQGNKAD